MQEREKMSNLYTSVPSSPTENPRDPLVFPSVERSVENYENVPSSMPSSSSSDPSQHPMVSTSDGNTPLYSAVYVKPQPVRVPPVEDSCIVYSEVTKTQGVNVSISLLILQRTNPRTSCCRTSCTLW